MDEERMRELLTNARSGRLATISSDGRPSLVPFVFALDGDTIYSCIDDKPKTTPDLQRLKNIARDERVSVLVDRYEDQDWRALWWVRVDGRARVVEDEGERARALAALAAKYAQYRKRPPSGAVIAIEAERWLGWAAT